MSRYRFIEAEKHQHTVSLLCRVLEVSRAAYYRWKASPLSARALANLVLFEQIRKAHTDSDGKYGSPRIHAELQDQGVKASRGRIARLMAASGIVGRRGRRRVRTTIPAKKPAPFGTWSNVISEPEGPNELWCGDLTYVHTGEGFLYLAYGDRCLQPPGDRLGHRPSHAGRTGLGRLAHGHHQPRGQVSGVIFHSDRGAQYGAGILSGAGSLGGRAPVDGPGGRLL